MVIMIPFFTVAKLWKQSRCPTTEKWARKIWYIHTMEAFSATKNGIISLAGKWIRLEVLRLSELNHRLGLGRWQSSNVLAAQHKDLSLIPSTHVQKLQQSALGRRRQADPWGLLASQSVQLGEL